ncbi:disulfide bond formation protein B [Pseudomonas sp. 13B_2.1_Bac1]|jgi:disulfide bond formation protein DsbB|uniref:Disulfide bond formation protein B n=1 Tax=Pseudomonas aylmerensis TaxID=1869229 RepID=A0A2T4FU02_9PSED|nr:MULTISPECIES: disulfide bond formation protein B [Pseudomonas]AYF51603.1 disulfide bond formation protein B [Pseudomonas fluorescens]MBK5480023.1 disulfide bond formation protein B [Pseudomonas sp. TH21]MCU1783401.1 disulfide bond formation protein B [Pseudomonas sp. 13B_2.1_Bac1]OCW28636.1 disulfide bond formation protein B [Pseudomonas aylmerensis]PTC26879.1 disulfide bond formation protein B [Pseudomonas aylmerensis]
MSLAPSRSLFFLAFLAGGLTLGASFYLEFGASLRPCFLCQLQRVFLAAFTLINLAAALYSPKRSAIYLYGLASMGCALLGAITAVRQVLLQNAAPDQAGDCWPSLQYMIENLSLWQALQSAVKGTVDCVDINWTLFDLSLPEWSLLFFLGMLILGATQFSRLISSQRLRPARH